MIVVIHCAKRYLSVLNFIVILTLFFGDLVSPIFRWASLRIILCSAETNQGVQEGLPPGKNSPVSEVKPLPVTWIRSERTDTLGYLPRRVTEHVVVREVDVIVVTYEMAINLAVG